MCSQRQASKQRAQDSQANAQLVGRAEHAAVRGRRYLRDVERAHRAGNTQPDTTHQSAQQERPSALRQSAQQRSKAQRERSQPERAHSPDRVCQRPAREGADTRSREYRAHNGALHRGRRNGQLR